MKQLTFLFLLMWTFSLAVQAEKTPIILRHTTTDTSKFSAEKDRYVLTIDVVFDSDCGSIEVNGDAATDAEVYLYDSYGKIVNFAPVINSTLPVTAHGTYTLYIIGDGWYAEATFTI